MADNRSDDIFVLGFIFVSSRKCEKMLWYPNPTKQIWLLKVNLVKLFLRRWSYIESY